MTIEDASCKLLDWLDARVTDAGRGDTMSSSSLEPAGQFWLGRLAPERDAAAAETTERGERLNPCAIGLRVLPKFPGQAQFTVKVSFTTWHLTEMKQWRKRTAISESVSIITESDEPATCQFGRDQISKALALTGTGEEFAARIQVETRRDYLGRVEIVVLLVNSSEPSDSDHNLYECSLCLHGLETNPFVLESLPDSFRYDRRLAAYGINCGVQSKADGSIETTDTVVVQSQRPSYWNVQDLPPDLRFVTLGFDPIPQLQALIDAHRKWGAESWSNDALTSSASTDLWSSAMMAQAQAGALDFEIESSRLTTGLELLKSDSRLLHSFKLMNQAMLISAAGRYDSWRPFQAGFLLANLRSIVDKHDEPQTVDIVWFSTGGGKTETYLGLLLIAAFHERLCGKISGITAWSRFPLRLLSLQQTQRFADALAGAELVRRKEGIGGDCYSVGFLVGKDSTPNSISEDPNQGEPDPDDDEMPGRYKVLLNCPFCHEDSISMSFNRATWRLEHCCNGKSCPWPETALPFYIVDDEIYRFLPTLVVGTIDKAASVAWQTGMRALVGPPWSLCSERGHGYMYATRSKKKNGCLVPGCRGKRTALPMADDLYAPAFRLQDELHLLRDSLGAVDSHYESLLDHLQEALSGRRPKILASSATLNGYERQSEILYRREARVFPADGPARGRGFWTSDSGRVARRYIAVAPRGLTIEFVVNRTVTEIQAGVRLLLENPADVAVLAGFHASHAPELISRYGVQVLYGNTLRDLDAFSRSLESQLPVNGQLNSVDLTGKTAFEEVRSILDRLAKPEAEFGDRIHVVSASSMMSHGVDVDRLNIMVMLGLPLTASEFIQTTARVGRRWPGCVYVMHKMARERDAGVFASFQQFVKQADRLVEAIAITRRSRRVLEKTAAAFALSRILAIHEPKSPKPLTTVSALRSFAADGYYSCDDELAAASQALGLGGEMDEPLRIELQSWFDRFGNRLSTPAGNAKFPSELSPTGAPMTSLRDVEEVAPIMGIEDRE